MRRTNARGRALIQQFEKCVLKAYPDPGTGGDPWTIGWGECGPDIVKGVVWSQNYADRRFELALVQRERTVERLVKVPLTDNEFAALVSFEYNAGALANSTLLRMLNAGKPRSEVAEEFRKWVWAGGRVMNGLIRRRAAERDLFLRPN
jgi:lysozyme